MNRSTITLPLALTATFLLAGSADAATKNGITPVSPKAGKSVPAGESPTFKAKVKGPGTVWFHVCDSAKKDKDGLICHEASIGQGKKSGGTYKYTPELFDFPEFWLNNPGTYYWQAHRINCTVGSSDCRKEGPVVKFKVA
ncbi:MAG: hypothetical protein JHC95_01280 [Solirubrobacteraceae bacterium]|nr:hypothetical protein [Solirubrobacteraceae bacterium]